jgi:hypothetical protein
VIKYLSAYIRIGLSVAAWLEIVGRYHVRDCVMGFCAWPVRPRLPAMVAACFLAGCATVARDDLSRLPATYRTVVPEPSVRDGRAQYRANFCYWLTTGPAPQSEEACDKWLWPPPDESSSVVDPRSTARTLDSRLRVVVVGGSFGDCYGHASAAFDGLVDTDLQSKLQYLSSPYVEGRSGSDRNARGISDFVKRMTLSPGDRLILVGYSKGVSDILEALADPEVAAKVAAVVSIAGSVNGSPLADRYASLYDRFLSGARFAKCLPGDGRVLDSLRTFDRLTWLSKPLPPSGIRYYSISTFATHERVARALRHFYRILSRIDARNDGQLLTQDQLMPGSTLLGYLNSDHWEVAIQIEDVLPFWAHRKLSWPRQTRDAVLGAALLTVQQDLKLSANERQ